MPIASLALLAMAALVGSPDAAELVARLASDRASVRRPAAEALARMGPDAVPALLEAAGSRDLELRTRAAALLDAIEAQGLVRPTTLTLDFRDCTIAEVVDAIGRRGGGSLGLVPGADPARGERRIDLEADGTVTFWEAVDRLCRAGGLRLAYGSEEHPVRLADPRPVAPGLRRRGATVSEVTLVPDDGPTAIPTDTSGAFHVALLGFRLQRDRVFVPTPMSPGAPSHTVRFAAQLRLRAEPRLTVSWVGPPRLIEAVDDEGRSLRPEAPPPAPARTKSMLGQRPLPAQADLVLAYPDGADGPIRRLRGAFPVAVTARRGAPRVIPLAVGQSCEFGPMGGRLVVDGVKPAPDGRGTRIELVVTGPPRDGFRIPSDLRTGLQLPPEAPSSVEIVDARGRVCHAFDLATSTFSPGGVTRRTVEVAAGGGVGPPVEVRGYETTWATVEVPFEFRDVPTR